VSYFSPQGLKGAISALLGTSARLIPALRPPHDPDRELFPRSWMTGRRMSTWERTAVNATPPSFVDFLRYRDWDRVSGCFVMDDGKSAGMLWELSPAPTEGRDEQTLSEMHEAFTEAIRSGLTEDVDSPWIAQFFVQDEETLFPHWRQINDYIPESIRNTQLTKHWLNEVDMHLQQVAQPGGIFAQAAGGNAWRGKERRVFVTLYRIAPKRGTLPLSIKLTKAAASQFTAVFAKNGVSLRGCRGRDLYEWMTPMLNPSPDLTGGDPYAYMRQNHYPDEVNGQTPPAWDLAEATVRSAPEQVEDGVWSFQGTLYTALTVQLFSKALNFGHLTGENRNATTLMDQMPPGTRISTTVIAEPQYLIERHMTALESSAVGDGAHAVETLEETGEARRALVKGEKLYRTAVVIYVTGKSLDELNTRADACTAILNQSALPPYARKYDLFRSGAFITGLPFGYDHARDRAGPKRATLQFTSEISKLIPIAGRSTGTGSPCLNFFNRGAAPLSFDPIKDRDKNAHLTVFGPTGSGKSAFLTNALIQTMAVHRPYLFIIDPKWPAPSFALLMDYFKSQGLTTNKVTLTPDTDVAINPFHCAMQLLDEDYDEKKLDEEDIEGGRDLMGEMVYLALAMTTGGEQKEMDNIRRADRPVFSQAIRLAAKTVKEAGGTVVITENVVAALHQLAEETKLGKQTAMKYHEHAEAMRVFCDGFAGKIFNRPGTPWPTCDVTLIEFAQLGTPGNEDLLNVGFMSLIQAIQLHITKHQYGDGMREIARNTIVCVDESHYLAKMPLMGAYIAKSIKTWRSSGAWYWQATQSIDDFAGPMKPLLTQLEWMICLAMPKDEVTKLKELKSLTAEQATMVESARKSAGEYSEGVVLHEKCTALFRAVLPSLSLALAQTEQHERAKRRDYMVANRCTEIEATYHIARTIYQSRASHATKRIIKPWSDRK